MKDRTMISRTIYLALAASLCVTGCSKDKANTDGDDVLAPQCDMPDGYIAFDSSNHQNQDLRLAAFHEMTALMSAAVDDEGEVDTAKFTAAKEIYTDETMSADLRTKVSGRIDEHVTGEPSQGDRLDATIIAFLEAGESAATALEAKVAKQWVDKTLQEFFFLSVHHELLAGDRAHWDEAFGYFGSQSDAAEAGLMGLASTASKRDGSNATDLLPETFNALIDGACLLETALTDEDVSELPVADVEGLEAVIEEIDGNVQKVLAYSAGHEAFEMLELIEGGAEDTDSITVKAAELVPFFIPLERIMLDRGGDSADRAATVRAELDKMPTADAQPDTAGLMDTAWIQEVNPQAIIDALDAEFMIEIKG